MGWCALCKLDLTDCRCLDEDEPSPVANVAAQEDALIRMIDASDPGARVRAAERGAKAEREGR